ncbi:MAG: OmpA family protein [bacterium]
MQIPLANRDAWGRWVLPALVVSLLLHVLFWNWSKHVPVERAGGEFEEKDTPRAFQVQRVEMDPRVMDPERDESPKVSVSTAAVRLPEENFSPATPVSPPKNAPRLDSAILNEKPVLGEPLKPGPSVANAPPSTADQSITDMIQEMPALKADPLASLPQTLPAAETGQSLVGPAGRGRGFTNLDELLAKTGPLTPETAPILLPGDLLFEYDAYRLQPVAISSMQKLGQILLRNPRSRFLIEGHSDSFGPDDYNLRLSELRAETVKNWLISSMGIPAESIETRGYGKSRLIAPATGTIEEQQINRRVEIVIRPPAP